MTNDSLVPTAPLITSPKPRKRAKYAVGGITQKERALVRRVVDGEPIITAAKAVGMSESSAFRALKRDNVRIMINALLDEVGLTDRTLAGKLYDGLEAIKTGLTKDGDVVDMGPDHMNIVRYLEMAFRLRDRFPNPKLDVEHNVKGAVILRAEDTIGPDPFSDVIDGEYSEI